jgi:hypothetical protein
VSALRSYHIAARRSPVRSASDAASVSRPGRVIDASGAFFDIVTGEPRDDADRILVIES